jgi:hypothetical protein
MGNITVKTRYQLQPGNRNRITKRNNLQSRLINKGGGIASSPLNPNNAMLDTANVKKTKYNNTSNKRLRSSSLRRTVLLRRAYLVDKEQKKVQKAKSESISLKIKEAFKKTIQELFDSSDENKETEWERIERERYEMEEKNSNV